MSDYNSGLPVRTQNNGDVVAKIGDGTTPSQQLAIDSSGRITSKLNDGSGNAVTSQTNGVQRALDVGVNVSGVQIDPRQIRALTNADVVKTQLQDNAGTAIILGQKVSASSVPVVIASDQSNLNIVQQLGGSAVSATNPLPVYLQDGGTSVNNYNTASAIAAAATSNHDYTVTTAKTLHLSQFHASASGKLKIECQIETGAATGIFNTIFVGFNSTSSPNIDITLSAETQVAAGVRVRIIRTNLDLAAQDVYSTTSGHEQ